MTPRLRCVAVHRGLRFSVPRDWKKAVKSLPVFSPPRSDLRPRDLERCCETGCALLANGRVV